MKSASHNQVPAEFSSRLQYMLEIVRKSEKRGALTPDEERAVADLRIALRTILSDDQRS
jgi:hypothetical protein